MYVVAGFSYKCDAHAVAEQSLRENILKTPWIVMPMMGKINISLAACVGRGTNTPCPLSPVFILTSL